MKRDMMSHDIEELRDHIQVLSETLGFLIPTGFGVVAISPRRGKVVVSKQDTEEFGMIVVSKLPEDLSQANAGDKVRFVGGEAGENQAVN